MMNNYDDKSNDDRYFNDAVIHSQMVQKTIRATRGVQAAPLKSHEAIIEESRFMRSGNAYQMNEEDKVIIARFEAVELAKRKRAWMLKKVAMFIFQLIAAACALYLMLNLWRML